VTLSSICVFCGASSGAHPAYTEAARELGRTLARTGRRIVFGGGQVGMMGALADAALAAGGQVIGVIPKHLVAYEVAHPGLTELHVVGTMHARKQLMADRADAFVVLPGGLGTMEEFFEVWTWGQLGIHRKPYGLLNVHGYFDPLLAFLEHAVNERFIRPEHRKLLLVDTDPASLLERLERHRIPELPMRLDQSRA
jgi:uncharacterized protein (TIGR00730 family)